MSRSLERRVIALEADSPAAWATRAEEAFWRAVSNASGNFGPFDAELTAIERLARFTPLEHMAWELKFTGETDLEGILALYGLGGPEDISVTDMQKWAGWVLLTNWMPGD